MKLNWPIILGAAAICGAVAGVTSWAIGELGGGGQIASAVAIGLGYGAAVVFQRKVER